MILMGNYWEHKQLTLLLTFCFKFHEEFEKSCLAKCVHIKLNKSGVISRMQKKKDTSNDLMCSRLANID